MWLVVTSENQDQNSEHQFNERQTGRDIEKQDVRNHAIGVFAMCKQTGVGGRKRDMCMHVCEGQMHARYKECASGAGMAHEA